MFKLAFLFAGQGSQFVGMGQGIYNEYKIVRQTFEEASDITGMDIAKLCLEGPITSLSKTKESHFAIVTSGLAAFRVFMQEVGYAPQFLAGHSLGEYTALTSAGVFSFQDALSLVGLRAELAEAAKKEKNGTMSVIENVDTGIVAQLCKEQQELGKKVYVSCLSSATQTTISGDENDIMDFEQIITKKGGNATPLLTSAPYHCPLMEDYVEEFQKKLDSIALQEFRYPVISNATGLPYEGLEAVRTNLINHLLKPVQWVNIVNYLHKKGISLVIEMGPKNLLSKIVTSIQPELKAMCIGEREKRKELFATYHNTEMYSKHIPTLLTKCLVAGVATPNSNWDNEAYQKGVVEPYNRIKELQLQTEKDPTALNAAVEREALELLQKIFVTKQLPEKEQKLWFRQILEETGLNYDYKEFI